MVSRLLLLMKNSKDLHFLLAEKLTLIYIIISSCVIAVNGLDFNTGLHLLINRVYILLFILVFAYISTFRELNIIRFVRNSVMGILLAYWYPETYEINKASLNKDHLVAAFEQSLFGSQPSLTFSQFFPQNWFSEMMNFGYFSYYFIIVGAGLYFYLTDRKYFNYYYFSILCAFFVYYSIYLIFPVTGPQFYFSAIGYPNAHAGIFPDVGHYFYYHPTLSEPQTASNGFFQGMVEASQLVGERPTAAFPSSHVGITTLIMLLLFRNKNYLVFGLFFPVYLMLVAATVYIKAHYLVDLIAGLLSAVFFFSVSSKAFYYFRTTRLSRILLFYKWI